MAKESASRGDSDSPLASRRGNADPTDIDPSPVEFNTGQFGYIGNTMQPVPPVEEWQEMKPPSQTFPEPQGFPAERSPLPPQEVGTASGMTDGQMADAAFKHLGK